MKKWLALGMAAAMVFTMPMGNRAGGTVFASETAEEETLTVRIAKDIGDLNPHTMKSPMYVQNWMYESLVSLENGEIVPELAESWDVSEDGLNYTFHLRKGVTFSDGTAFDSEIARKNIEAVKNNAEGYSFLQSLVCIEEIETPDAETLVLKLNQPCNSLLNDFTFSRPLVMLGEAGFPAEGDPYENGIATPIGTGKWVLKEAVADQYAVFERNENYWGEKPAFQYLKAVVIPDVNTAAASLQAGEIDLMQDASQITADIYQKLEAEGFVTESVETTSISSLNLNTAGEITGDLNVRRALEYATDKSAISEGIYGGLQAPASAYFSKNVPLMDLEVETYEYDLEKANEILEEAGWVYENGSKVRSKDGKNLEIDLIYDSAVTKDRDIGLILQSQYAEAGVQLNIVPQESQVFRENWKTGAFGALIYSSWGGSYEPYATLAAMAKEGDKFHTVQKGMSNQAELDEVMLDCLTQTDQKKLQENFEKILKSFYEEAVYVPLTVTTKLCIYSNDLTGLKITNNQDSIDLEGLTRKQ